MSLGLSLHRFYRLFLIAGGILILDQVSKGYIHETFRLHESRVILNDFFSLTYLRNPGAAFGIFADQSPLFRSIFFFGISVIALVFLTVLFLKREDLWGQVSISLLFGGALGNLIDRIRLGEVIDFLDFYLGHYHWPAFNVADSAITVGVGFLIVESLFVKRPPPSV